MTASTKPKTEVPQEKFTFKLCDCGAAKVHGYFYDEDGDKRSDPAYSMTSALEMVKYGIEDSVIALENEPTLLAEIHDSGLPEKEDHPSVTSDPLGHLLMVLMDADFEEAIGGPHTLSFEEGGDGPVAIFTSAHGIKTDPITTKKSARRFIAAMTRVDSMEKADGEKFLTEIEASPLPEE